MPPDDPRLCIKANPMPIVLRPAGHLNQKSKRYLALAWKLSYYIDLDFVKPGEVSGLDRLFDGVGKK